MYRKLLATVAVVLIGCLTANACEEIKPTLQITGKNKNAVLKNFAPKNRIISDKNALQNLCAAWQPTKKVPVVDFDQDIVLVETVGGPNNLFANILNLNDQGNLTYDLATSSVGGSGFGYLIMAVPKAGIKQVNGVSITAPSAANPPTISGNVILKTPGTNREPDPVRLPGRSIEVPSNPGSASSAQSIKVDIVGKIQSGISAIGGETTGTVIGSNGIVWELEILNNFRMLKTVRSLGPNLARVQGTLVRVQGIEVPDRMVVKVNSVSPAGQLSAGDLIANSVPDLPSSGNLPPQMPTPTIPKAFKATNFRTILLTTSGGIAGIGQTHTLMPDGQITHGRNGQDVDTWKLDSEAIQMIDRLVAATDWKKVPRVSRSTDARDAFQYEILIESPMHTYRFFSDGPSIGRQTELAQILSLMIVRKQANPIN